MLLFIRNDEIWIDFCCLYEGGGIWMKMFFLPANLRCFGPPLLPPKKESKATARQKRTKRNLVGGFKYVYFHTYLGKIPIMTNMFQRG